jgi:pimeloyl-ACP methyl ester carboxylesterase
MQRVTMQRMMRRLEQRFVTLLRGTGLVAMMVSILVALSGAAVAAPDRGPKVYLLRGFMNVFSLGLDELSAKLEARGIRSEVYNHTSAMRLADEIAGEYKSGKTRPVILVGHSAGAAAVIDLVAALGQAGVPVALAVTLDISSRPIPGGQVATFLNLYSTTGALSRGPGFRGNLVNMDLGKNPQVGHFTIDKVEEVQALILRYVASAAGRGGPRRQPAAAHAAMAPRT